MAESRSSLGMRWERGSRRHVSYPSPAQWQQDTSIKIYNTLFLSLFSLLSQTSSLKSCLSRKYSQFSFPNLFSSLKTKSISCSKKKKNTSKVVLFLLHSSPLFSLLFFHSFSLLAFLHQVMVFLGLPLSVERQKEYSAAKLG